MPTQTMKAIVQARYGDASVLKYTDATIPEPKAGEVLIQVRAASLNAPDWRLLRGKPFFVRFSSGLTKPKHVIKGTDFSGVVVALGEGVSNFKVSDEVYGDLADSGFGTFAEYVCANEKVISKKPNQLSHLEAAALPLTSVTALQAVRDAAAVQPDENVLIIGASGGVGSYALQLVKYYGAHATGVTSSRHAEQAKQLGADTVIAYDQRELTACGQQFDVILAINGYNTLETYRSLLTPKGRLVLVGGKSMKQILQVAAFGGMLSKQGGQQFKALIAKPSAADLTFIAGLVDGNLLKPVIEREIALKDVPATLAELEKGHVGGKIAVQILA